MVTPYSPFNMLREALLGNLDAETPGQPQQPQSGQQKPPGNGMDMNKLFGGMFDLAKTQHRLDINGQPESGPHGLDYLDKFGPLNEKHHANSLARYNQLGREAGVLSPEQQRGMSQQNHQHPLELDKQGNGYSPFGAVSNAPTMEHSVENVNAGDWFKAYGPAHEGTNTPAAVLRMSPEERDLHASDRGYSVPRAQAPQSHIADVLKQTHGNELPGGGARRGALGDAPMDSGRSSLGAGSYSPFSEGTSGEHAQAQRQGLQKRMNTGDNTGMKPFNFNQPDPTAEPQGSFDPTTLVNWLIQPTGGKAPFHQYEPRDDERAAKMAREMGMSLEQARKMLGLNG